MAIDMYGNYTPDANPFISQPSNALTGFVPPLDTASMDAQIASAGVIPQATGGFLSSALDFLGSDTFSQALRTGGQYYLGQENIKGAQQLGRETQAGAQALAQEARAGTEFKPYTVTSGLANVATDPTGGFAVTLSPEQQALQAQLQGQVGGLFGQVGADPATAQAALYEQMRATQRPEEERQRLALEERMLSQGRLGLGSAAYGGSSPELLAQETARQEAMARANLGARQQAMAEQSQAAQLGGMLQAAGYQPQQQALSMLSASQVPAGYADIARRTGTELATQMGLGGLEARLQAEDLANRLQLQQGEAILGSLFGQQATAQEQILNRILNKDGALLEGTAGLLTGGIDWLGDKLGFGG